MNCKGNPSSDIKCSRRTHSKKVNSLADLIEQYRSKYNLRKVWHKQISFPEATFGDVIFPPAEPIKDTLSNNEWDKFLKQVKIHPHQSRYYSKSELREIAEHLAKHWNRNSFKDFEDLYDYIRGILCSTPSNSNILVKNPLALLIYDIALRLAHRFGVWPKKYVYLNGSGPFEAIKILGLGKLKKKRRILYSDIITRYPKLGILDAAELEDFLCIYKKEILELQTKGLL